ncbi:MYCBP-associated protein family [Carpediemonas membranifera]|uniref:MYCBP-associated protein family n=1 Tax=Carpediemonas membranifera TaxID=201153 RepID=A0A8J6BZH1_9EUKA|nr:MYCBP-associated protein family [Carpediemonas membranifera]|eukprot:KAG9395526.1 MYCBP-associated protein family [Carpediemonas membranifera]
MQDQWARYAHRISSRLDRPMNDNMLARSRDYRRVVEVKQMLDAARPPASHSEDWQMSLRGDVESERFVPIGSVFSGLFVKVQGPRTQPIIRTGVPGSGAGAMAQVASKIAAAPKARQRLQYLPAQLAPIEADIDGLIIEGQPLPVRDAIPFPDDGEETAQLVLDEPEGDAPAGSVKRKETPARSVRIEEDNEPQPSLNIATPKPALLAAGGIAVTEMAIENTGNTVVEVKWTPKPRATSLLGLRTKTAPAMTITPEHKTLIPGEVAMFRIMGEIPAAGIFWSVFELTTLPAIPSAPKTIECTVGSFPEYDPFVEDDDLEAFHDELAERAVRTSIQDIVDGMADRASTVLTEEERRDPDQELWDAVNKQYGLYYSPTVFRMLEALFSSARLLIDESAGVVEPEDPKWDADLEALVELIQSLPDEGEDGPTPRQTHLSLLSDALQLAATPSDCVVRADYSKYLSVRDRRPLRTVHREAAVRALLVELLGTAVGPGSESVLPTMVHTEPVPALPTGSPEGVVGGVVEGEADAENALDEPEKEDSLVGDDGAEPEAEETPKETEPQGDFFETLVAQATEFYQTQVAAVTEHQEALKTAHHTWDKARKKQERKLAEKKRMAAEIGETYLETPEDGPPPTPALPPKPDMTVTLPVPAQPRHVPEFSNLVNGMGTIYFPRPPEPEPEPEPEDTTESAPSEAHTPRTPRTQRSARAKKEEPATPPKKSARPNAKDKKTEQAPSPEPTPEPEPEVDPWEPAPEPNKDAIVLTMARPLISGLVERAVGIMEGADGFWAVLDRVHASLRQVDMGECEEE